MNDEQGHGPSSSIRRADIDVSITSIHLNIAGVIERYNYSYVQRCEVDPFPARVS